MNLEKRSTSAGTRVTAKALGAIRPRTPTLRCRSISRVSRRPISTGWRLLRNGLANSLHQTLEALLELLESHGPQRLMGPRDQYRPMAG